MAFRYCSCIYREGQDVKSLYIWFVVLFPQQQGVLRLCHLTRGFAWGFFKPLHMTHTHTNMHTQLHPLSLSHGFFFFCLSVALTLPSPFLPLFSVQFESPSSLYQTTSFDTHSKSLSVNSCTDRMRPCLPKSLTTM